MAVRSCATSPHRIAQRAVEVVRGTLGHPQRVDAVRRRHAQDLADEQVEVVACDHPEAPAVASAITHPTTRRQRESPVLSAACVEEVHERRGRAHERHRHPCSLGLLEGPDERRPERRLDPGPEDLQAASGEAQLLFLGRIGIGAVGEGHKAGWRKPLRLPGQPPQQAGFGAALGEAGDVG
mgnify:CR=1 FL=1